MKIYKRIPTFALALLLYLGLAVPTLAASEPEIEIQWLHGVDGYSASSAGIASCNTELDWVSISSFDGKGDLQYVTIDLSTGSRVEEYEWVEDFSDGLAVVGKRNAEGNWKYGYINTEGREVIPLEYDRAEKFSDGLALVEKRDAEGKRKFDYINTEGQVAIPLEGYYGAWSFSNGLALVAKTDAEGKRKFGFINTEGQVVVPLEYDNYRDYITYPYHFSDGLAYLIKDYKFWYVDMTGAVVISSEDDWSYGYDFSDGLARVVKRDAEGKPKYGFINTKGRVVVPLEYDMAEDFSDGLALVAKTDAEGEEKYGFINTKGQLAIPLEYDWAYSFFDGLALVAKHGAEGLVGFIDTKGQVVILLESNVGYHFSDGLFRVLVENYDGNREYGFINTEGQAVIPLEYEFAELFYQNRDYDNPVCPYGWVQKGSSIGIFKNPYWQPETDGAAEGGFSMLPGGIITIAVAAVVAVVIVAAILLLIAKRKKAASAPSAVAQALAPGDPPGGTPASAPVEPPMSAPTPPTQEAYRFCYKCGKPLVPEANFCPFCGQNIQI